MRRPGTEDDQMGLVQQHELPRSAAIAHGDHRVVNHNMCSYDTEKKER